ncbi:MAG: Nif11-like leader peptide family natural product precursor [Cyanobium sp. NAT70]|nr:Nif11-like leader peptide family natural product precursor [Cyanobium sp. NAT70]|tara:strand:+ start:5346 stop:5624 length:279 start_codon:yes stop_codon:yes gene_type:complete
MSEEQLKAFLEKVKADTSLQEKLKGAVDPDSISAIAKSAGFTISRDDFELIDTSEVSELDLENISGGGSYYGSDTRLCNCTRSDTCKGKAGC